MHTKQRYGCKGKATTHHDSVSFVSTSLQSIKDILVPRNNSIRSFVRCCKQDIPSLPNALDTGNRVAKVIDLSMLREEVYVGFLSLAAVQSSRVD